MAWGGGTFLTNNKILPGAYINFVSRARASIALSECGILAAPLFLNWGPEGQVYDISPDEFQTDSMKLFGYAFDAPEMFALREIFGTSTRLLKVFRLAGETAKATCAPGGATLATARYGGTRGNDLKITVEVNVDNESLWDIKTYIGNDLLEMQSGIANAQELRDNDFVVFNKSTALAATVAAPFIGGSNGTVSGLAMQNALDAFESHAFHTLLCPVADLTTARLFINFARRMRDDVGAKFTLVAWRAVNDTAGYTPDFEGVISVDNEASGYPEGVDGLGAHSLVYRIAAMCAACAVNASLTNQRYDGELTINTAYKQRELEAAIKAGKFMLHQVGDTVRVLADINTFISVTPTKNEIFQSNQAIRVCDQIANDVAVHWNDRYLGKVQNDQDGRNAFKGDVILLIQKLEAIRAVESFDPDTVDALEGEQKDEVILILSALDIVQAMAKLYMTVVLV